MSGNKTRRVMKTKPKKRNRAAQDSTLINIRALKKRVRTLELAVKFLLHLVDSKPARFK